MVFETFHACMYGRGRWRSQEEALMYIAEGVEAFEVLLRVATCTSMRDIHKREPALNNTSVAS